MEQGFGNPGCSVHGSEVGQGGAHGIASARVAQEVGERYARRRHVA